MAKPDLNLHQLHNELVVNGQLKRYLLRHSNSTDEAADIYQESITRVIERAHHHQIENPLAYAIRVARNLLNKRPPLTLVIPEELDCPRGSPEDLVASQQRVDKIQEALEKMPKQRRLVFEKRRIHGETRKAIATQLGISVESVSKHLTRALADIQRDLDKN